MATSLTSFKKPFFIGIAGAGMSALAQYLHGIGMEVSGSDRFFLAGEENETRTKLEAEGIRFSAEGRIDLKRFQWSGPDWGWLVENGFKPEDAADLDGP